MDADKQKDSSIEKTQKMIEFIYKKVIKIDERILTTNARLRHLDEDIESAPSKDDLNKQISRQDYLIVDLNRQIAEITERINKIMRYVVLKKDVDHYFEDPRAKKE